MAINPSNYETQMMITQFAGIDQRQGDSAVSLAYAYKAENVHTERGMLESAGGYEPAMPPLTAAIGTLARFYRRSIEQEDEREVFVAATLDGIYTWTAGTDAWIRRYPAEGTLYKDAWSYVTYETVRNAATVDVLLMTNDRDGMVIVYGDDLSAQKIEINMASGGKTLKFSHIERHNERIWGCGQPGEPDNLYYSRPYEILNWDPIEGTPELGGGMIQQPTWDGDEFIALRRFGAYLVACKKRSMWLIRGTDPSTFTIEEVYGSDAPASAASIAVDGAQMFYLSESGIGVYDGSAAQLLDKNALYETMMLRAPGCEERATACVARHVYYLALAVRNDAYEEGNIENNTIIEYDTIRGTFLLRTGIPVRSMYAAGGKVYFTTSMQPYQVFTLGSGTGYNGQSVHAYWQTGWMDLGGKNVQKSAFELRFYAKGETGATMTLTVETERKEKQKSVALYETGKMHKVRIANRGKRFRLKIETEGTQAWSIMGGMQINMDIDGE